MSGQHEDPYGVGPLQPLCIQCGHWDWRGGRGYRCDYTALEADMTGYIGGRFFCPDHQEAARRDQLLHIRPDQIARLLHDIATRGREI